MHSTLKAICLKWNHVGSHVRGVRACSLTFAFRTRAVASDNSFHYHLLTTFGHKASPKVYTCISYSPSNQKWPNGEYERNKMLEA